MKLKWNGRAFAALLLFWSLTGVVLSGIVLYIAPQGRIAHWVEWRFLWLTKEQWEALHTLLGYLFAGAGVYHILLNGRALIHYLRRRKTLRWRPEALVSLVVALGIGVGAVADVPPFGYVMDLSDWAKDAWARRYEEPPQPHAELLPLRDFAQTLGLRPEEAVAQLTQAGLQVPSDTLTLQALGELNGRSPQEIADLLHPPRSSPTPPASHRGYGQWTLRELAQTLGLPLDSLLGVFHRAGLQASPDHRVRDLASKLHLTPYDLVELLRTRKPFPQTSR